MNDPSSPHEALRQLVDLFGRHGIHDFALTGSVALGAWVAPRSTNDIDVCGVLPVAAVDRIVAQQDGMRVGAAELPDMIRFRVGDWDVDFFVSKSEYDATCLARSIRLDVDGIALKVVTPEDLIIHKLLKLRTDRRRLLQDLADLRALVQGHHERLDWAYLRRWLPAGEAAFVEAVATVDDEELARRILGA